MTTEQKNITVKLKRGSWEVLINCPPEEVEKTVKAVLASLTDQLPQEEQITEKKGRTSTCKTLVEALWREGFFLNEKTLAEVDVELSRRGYHYDRTAVSHTLADLVREGILTRLGNMRSYRYVQKKPP